MRIETKAIHAGDIAEQTHDVTSAIHLSTTFHKADDGSLPGGHLYARVSNPNREALERALAALEQGSLKESPAALVFSSGSAATMTVLQSLAPGDHVIAPEDAYYGTPILLKTVMAPWGLKFSLVNMQDLNAVERAVTPATKLIWAETPSNPLLNITDLSAVAAITKKANALFAVDNTWATPLLTRPLELGADVVMHSVTKYLSGHSDVLCGALVFREAGDLYQRARHIQHEGGAVPSPFECWLTLRGLQTFPYRVRAQSESAQRIAEFLEKQPKIEAVHYPGLPSHAGHKIAARQMSAFGGMMSIQVKGGQTEAFKLAAGLKLFSHATSLGGTHSLVEHRASAEGEYTRSPKNLLRLSIGLEHPDDLMEDLEQGLTKL
ncbi:MAG: aminotransferase class I/II-fold pyridoxal phosphate-dependent enzyme [Acidobacteriia bacterium]|nr:aminotransferase class I/II-fold pyridoxal phosphate-dependent enzyme [Terriglobia bacterium]